MAGYLLYSLSLFFLILATVLYFTRSRWTPYLPPIPYITAPGRVPGPLYSLIPSSFQADLDDGLSSASFNLADNVEAGDTRAGLDDAAKAAVRRIMARRRVDFDEARRIYLQERFRGNNIGEDGRPRDPKTIMFS